MSTRELIAVNYGWIRGVAEKFCHISEDADDLAAETVCRCLAASHRFDLRRQIRPWIYTVMYNIYRNDHKHRQRIRMMRYEDERPFTSSHRSEHRAEYRDLLAFIRHYRDRYVGIDCLLLYMRGYDQSEIAEMKGIPIGTVRSRICNARKMLRTRLAEQGYLTS